MAGDDIGKERDAARLNPRRKAMENHGCRPDVHKLLTRFITDLLNSEPPDPAAYMYMWAAKEQQRPKPKLQASPQAQVIDQTEHIRHLLTNDRC